MGEVQHINRLRKSGTSRAYRKTILEPANAINPEERKLEELISLTASLAKRIKYYNFQNEHEKGESWYEFFSDDITFVLADILDFDSEKNQALYKRNIRRLQYLLFIGESADEKWQDMVQFILGLLQRVDAWMTAFKYPDPELSGFRKELWSTRDELQSSLFDLIHLYNEIESINDKRLELAFKQLSNFTTDPKKLASYDRSAPPSDVNKQIFDELETVYRSFSTNLLHLKKSAQRYFRRSFKTQSHEPHAGLLITFLQLYRELSVNFNDYTEHHREFFYKDVLRARPSKATPDKAILLFGVDDSRDYVSIPQGALFPAGKNESGEDILFKSTSPLALNRATITRIRTLLLGNNDLYKPPVKSNTFDFVTGIFTADRTNQNFSGSKWPLLGADQSGVLSQNRSMQDALIGFALSSPAFYLKEGERDVSIDFHLSKTSYREFAKKLNAIAEGELKDNKTAKKADSRGLLLRILTDGFLLDYTSDDGWYRKDQFFVDITEDRATGGAVMELSFQLKKKEPSVSAYRADIHGLMFRKNDPVIRLRLNPDAPLYPYSLMSCLKISSISCEIEVRELENLAVYNEVGLVNAGEAFMPFGPVPVRKSWMAISHPEAFNKNIDKVSLELVWEDVPDAPHGFHSYYSRYPGDITNESFRVKAYELSSHRWIPLEKRERYLFRTERQIEPDKPEAIGRLSTVTRLDSISLINTTIVDRPDQINQHPEYTSQTKEGFIKIELTSPPGGFGHKQYPQLMSNTFLQNAKVKKLKEIVGMPNEPFTPLLRRITMDYVQVFNKTVKENTERGGIDIYHIKSFDESEIINADLQDDTENLFPQTNHRGQIIFDIAGAKPPQILSLFFQLRDTISDNVLDDMPEIGWEYYANLKWIKFKEDEVIRDDTNGFMNSGIVVLELPEILLYEDDYLQQGTIQIRAFACGNPEVVSRAVGVTTQAAQVVRVIKNSDENYLPVPAGSITAIQGNIPGLSSIHQPLPSYGGRSPESEESYIIRVSELLKHRGSAVLSRDFERLILQKFTDVRMVNCMPGISTENDKSEPGNVLIVVIPDASRYPDTSRFRPRFSAGRLSEIEAFIKEKISEFATVEVRNPRYERITIRCTVKFKKGIESGLYLKTLKSEISRYISPWCFDSDVAIEFDRNLDLTNIRGFIHSRDYVEMVTGLSAVKISEKSRQKYELFDSARTQQSHKKNQYPPKSYKLKKLSHQPEGEMSKGRVGKDSRSRNMAHPVLNKLGHKITKTARSSLSEKQQVEKRYLLLKKLCHSAKVSKSETSNEDTVIDVIHSSKPWCVMVTDRDHDIEVVSSKQMEEGAIDISPVPVGIDTLILSDSFIITGMIEEKESNTHV